MSSWCLLKLVFIKWPSKSTIIKNIKLSINQWFLFSPVWPQWIHVVCLQVLSWKDWVSTRGIWGHLTYLEPERGPGNPKKVVNFILGSLTSFSILFPLFIFTPLNWTSESLWGTALWVAERWAERTRLKSQLSSLSQICANAFQSNPQDISHPYFSSLSQQFLWNPVK